MKKMNKKAFTLIELIVTIAVLGVLVLLASPRFFGHTQNAELTRGFANARSIEKASELYYMDHEDWPRLTDEPYTSEEIESYSERIFNHTGQEINLDPEGNYYDIDYDKLSDYIQVPDDKKNYILQNPVGKIYYMENLSAEGEKRVDYENKMQANIETPNKPAINNITDNSAVIDGGSGTEVRIGEGEWHDSPHTFTNLNEDTSYTAYSRYKKTETHLASNVSNGYDFKTEIAQKLFEFAYTGQPQNIELGKGTYKIEVWGASGGKSSQASVGGKGGYAKGNIVLNKDEVVAVYVGGQGSTRNNAGGGWNGGGNSGSYTLKSHGGGGGGGTDIRRSGTSIDNIIIVAGGGGGAGANNPSDTDEFGGYGGGNLGGNGGSGNYRGYGGTQTSGGAGGLHISNPGISGTMGNGGKGGATGGGGGGGYYGGGGGAYEGAGGGSGFIGGVQDGQTIAGNQSMPNPNGGTMVGKSGHGFARITRVD